MTLGVTFGGYSKAEIECSKEWIAFVISLDKDFDGVIYTRGNFHDQDSPCFHKATGGKDFAMKFPMDRCGIEYSDWENAYVTTVIIQNDSELTMTGDLAFRLSCLTPKDGNDALSTMRSKISLVSPDPAAEDTTGYHTAMSPSLKAVLSPPKPKEALKEEL